MRRYYFGFMFLTAGVILAVIKGFLISGTPFTQKALNFDSQRLSRMGSIKYSIDSFYQDNGTLPETLDQLPGTNNLNDPETQKPFDYKVVSATSYTLCTTFSTDTKATSSQYGSYSYTSVADTTFYHQKGYDCVTLKTPQAYRYATPIPTKIPQDHIVTFFGTVDSVAKSETDPRVVVKDNLVMRIFAVSTASILNKDGEVIGYETFQASDKVIVDAYQANGQQSFVATRIQNLSR